MLNAKFLHFCHLLTASTYMYIVYVYTCSYGRDDYTLPALFRDILCRHTQTLLRDNGTHVPITSPKITIQMCAVTSSPHWGHTINPCRLCLFVTSSENYLNHIYIWSITCRHPQTTQPPCDQTPSHESINGE